MDRKWIVLLLGISLVANGVLFGLWQRERTRFVESAAAAPTAVADAAPEVERTSTDAPATSPPIEEPSPAAPSPTLTVAPTMTPTTAPTLAATPSPTPAETASPTPEVQPSPTIAALGPDWLRFVNLFREAAQLPPLLEDPAWSAEGGLHSRYMVITGDISHSEDAGNPHFTSSGNRAADHGNIAIGNLSSAPYEWAFNYWISAPFHAVPILDPELAMTGFGEYRDPAGSIARVGATMDVERGRGALPAGVQFPIMWPGAGSTTWVLRYSLPEFPDALSVCAGYTQATGAPVILQIGDGSLTPNVTGASLVKDGEPMDFCLYDETNFTHPDAWTQKSARLILDQRDAIVLIPRAPLLPDSTYEVRIDANGQVYTWNFQTAVGPPRD